MIKQERFPETKLFKAMVNGNIEYAKIKGLDFNKCQKVTIQKFRRRAFKLNGKFDMTDLSVQLLNGNWSRLSFVIK